jgi:hypothetical protein
LPPIERRAVAVKIIDHPDMPEHNERLIGMHVGSGMIGGRDRAVPKLIRSVIPGAVLAAAVAVAVGAAPAATASAGPAQGSPAAGNTTPAQATPAVLECGAGAALTRPASLILTCADDGELAEQLQWSSWTASQATASGIVTWRNCVSLCADARQWKSAAADITLTDPVSEPGEGLLFTQINLNVTGPTPAGFQRTLSFDDTPAPAEPSAPSTPPPATSPAVVQPASAPSGTLSYARIEGFWDIAGGPTAKDHIPGHGTYTDSQVAAAITGAESSFLPGVIQPDVDYCDAGADKAGWGLWQITCGNSVPKFGKDFQVLDPWNNAEAAVSKCHQDVKDGHNCFSPWATWASGTYTQFLEHTAADRKLTDPGEYVQVNATPPGTPKRPAAHPGSKFGPKLPATTKKAAPPQAAFAASVDFLLQEQPVVFDGSGSKPGPGSKIKSYSWTLGDGTTASGAKASHAFVTSANVTVTLMVTDTDGLHSSVSHSYFVLPSDSSASNYVAGAANQEHLFYRSSAGALDQDWLSATKWSHKALPGSPAADPVTLNYAGQEHVFYIGAGGAIDQDTWNGKAWVRQTPAGESRQGQRPGRHRLRVQQRHCPAARVLHRKQRQAPADLLDREGLGQPDPGREAGGRQPDRLVPVPGGRHAAAARVLYRGPRYLAADLVGRKVLGHPDPARQARGRAEHAGRLGLHGQRPDAAARLLHRGQRHLAPDLVDREGLGHPEAARLPGLVRGPGHLRLCPGPGACVLHRSREHLAADLVGREVLGHPEAAGQRGQGAGNQ